MNTPRKNRVKSVLQAISLLLGLWGILSICFAVYFFVLFFTGKGHPGLGTVLMLLPMGCYTIFTSYIMIRKFSRVAIKHFCAIIVVFLYGGLIQIFIPYTSPSFEEHPRFLLILLSFLLMIIVYKIGEKILAKLTLPTESE